MCGTSWVAWGGFRNVVVGCVGGLHGFLESSGKRGVVNFLAQNHTVINLSLTPGMQYLSRVRR